MAFNKYFEPEFQQYEIAWFDRAHNKLFDVLVMQGVLRSGISIYLVACGERNISVARLKTAKTFCFGAALTFFGAAYFVQNLFVFDQITTYIPLFMFWGFVIHMESEKAPEVSDGTKEGMKYLSLGLTVALLFSFMMYSFIPWRQMARMEGYLG